MLGRPLEDAATAARHVQLFSPAMKAALDVVAAGRKKGVNRIRGRTSRPLRRLGDQYTARSRVRAGRENGVQQLDPAGLRDQQQIAVAGSPAGPVTRMTLLFLMPAFEKMPVSEQSSASGRMRAG
jgi:hypothetical protein